MVCPFKMTSSEGRPQLNIWTMKNSNSSALMQVGCPSGISSIKKYSLILPLWRLKYVYLDHFTVLCPPKLDSLNRRWIVLRFWMYFGLISVKVKTTFTSNAVRNIWGWKYSGFNKKTFSTKNLHKVTLCCYQ